MPVRTARRVVELDFEDVKAANETDRAGQVGRVMNMGAVKRVETFVSRWDDW